MFSQRVEVKPEHLFLDSSQAKIFPLLRNLAPHCFNAVMSVDRVPGALHIAHSAGELGLATIVGQVLTKGLRPHDVLSLAQGLGTVLKLDRFAIVAVVLLSMRVGENLIAIPAGELLSMEAIQGESADFTCCRIVQFAIGTTG